jgi:hypothetical protein
MTNTWAIGRWVSYYCAGFGRAAPRPPNAPPPAQKPKLRQKPMTILHNDEPIDFKGRTSDSWCCVDCGMNTAPGTPPRRLMAFLFQQAGMDSEVKSCITWDSEVYTVRDSVWKKAGIAPMGGCLCIGCLERRIGRRLEPKDFPADDAFNHPDLPATERLLNRRSR